MKAFHSLCLAAPRSGEGKTIASIALMRLFARRGLRVQAFKCGPDYIDPSFHTQATGRPACNLDTWMMGHEGVQSLWDHRTQDADMAICEGVMGLFDGRDIDDLAGSTADCARTLDIPVILLFNARGMAGSVVALADGFYHHAKGLGVHIAGFLANNVGSPRHADILREALAQAHLPPLSPLPPLLGALPRCEAWRLPERQLGLLPSNEIGLTDPWLDALADEAEKYIDIQALLAISTTIRPQCPTPQTISHVTPTLRMGIAKDHAFCFYYEENERTLVKQGWELIPFSPLVDTSIPANIDALYLGGGYPEVFARELSENTSMRESIRHFAQAQGEIYAECGGYMYLCAKLEVPDKNHDTQASYTPWPMCGVIDATARMGNRIRSLGYREVALLDSAPFGLTSTYFRGHEFHWSDIKLHREYPPLYAVHTKSGTERAGVHFDNVKAGYVHLYWGHGNTTFGTASKGMTSPVQCPADASSAYCATALPRVSGQVILLNGPSSVGKTSLSKALQTCLKTRYGQSCMVLSIDHFLKAGTGAYESLLAGISQTKLPFIETFHASIATAAKAGALVIADHVIGENPEWIKDLTKRLGDIPILSVQLACETNVLQEREMQRLDRTPDWKHTERQVKTIYKPLPNQIHLDTTQTTPEDGAVHILHILFGKHDKYLQCDATIQYKDSL